jgi:hypothetical protein
MKGLLRENYIHHKSYRNISFNMLILFVHLHNMKLFSPYELIIHDQIKMSFNLFAGAVKAYKW